MATPMILQATDSENFIVRAGICQAVVCTSMTDKAEITRRVNLECPSGTSHRWALAKRGKGKKNPEPCAEGKGNFHYLYEC